jgi:2-octaprenyl-6-methoxyphenol hydroxylase
VIGADGRNSPVRESLEIETRQWRYPQIALVGNFNHTLPHHDISTEFHTETGPFTLVPLGTNRSSLVCVVDPAQAERLKAMHKNDLNQLLEERMGSILGKVRLERALRGFPLSGMVAKRFGEGPVMLVGEAAHVFPPIGAQGLNLGLRDIREAIRLVGEGLAGRSALSSLGNTYSRARTTDINTRTASVDLLNRSLLSNLLPVQLARSAGLYTLGSLSPLRRLIMREGVAPGLATRSLPLSLSERPGANPIAGAEAKSDHST